MIRDVKVLEAYLSDLLDSMPDASFLVNSTGGLVLVNGLIEKLFGYQSGELRGKSIDATDSGALPASARSPLL